MRVEQITQMLAAYIQTKARCAAITVQIQELKAKMETEYSYRYVDEILRPAPMDGMPHGNMVGRTTETIAVRLADRKLSPQLAAMMEECANLYEERRHLRLQVDFVDAWLQALNEKERYVVEHHLVHGESWKETGIGYRRRFEEGVSKDTLRRIGQKALKKIVEAAS